MWACSTCKGMQQSRLCIVGLMFYLWQPESHCRCFGSGCEGLAWRGLKKTIDNKINGCGIYTMWACSTCKGMQQSRLCIVGLLFCLWPPESHCRCFGSGCEGLAWQGLKKTIDNKNLVVTSTACGHAVHARACCKNHNPGHGLPWPLPPSDGTALFDHILLCRDTRI